MKKLYIAFILVIIVLSGTTAAQAQLFCNAGGNLIIFSNYDGGILNINVDQNIPDLKIGIVSYEDDSVIISGPFVSNVTQVIYAGYYNTTHVHCSTNIGVKGVYGVSSSIVSIVFAPPATLSNSNGNNSIICNYSCSTTTSQGGCNTADQIEDYFAQQFIGSTLLFHFTQYGCWTGTYNISSGGNCCATVTVDVNDNVAQGNSFSISPNPSDGKFSINASETYNSIEIFNLLGEMVYTDPAFNSQTSIKIDLSDHPKGIYLVKICNGEKSLTKKIMIQ